MKVLRYSYELKEGDNFKLNSLVTDSIELSDLNLLVGRNASGKTTVANVLVDLASILKGTLRIGKYYIELESEDLSIFKYTYELTVKKDIIISETLLHDDKILINRNDTEGEIFSEKEGKLVPINPPNDKLVHQVRRDQIDHPYLEEIVRWAESVHSFKFGHIHSTSFLKSPFTNTNFTNTKLTSINDKDINKILGELKEETKSQIIKEFNLLGYNLKILTIKDEGGQNVIYVKENDLKYEINQATLSQGMFRSLFVLIFIHHLIEMENAKLIIIDDLCESLDYERATKLGNLLFNKMQDSNIQFIATSNDSFLMNVIDIKYWNIIYREKDTIKVYNYRNSKEKFDKFMDSGFNNFDLLTSNYLN